MAEDVAGGRSPTSPLVLQVWEGLSKSVSKGTWPSLPQDDAMFLFGGPTVMLLLIERVRELESRAQAIADPVGVAATERRAIAASEAPSNDPETSALPAHLPIDLHAALVEQVLRRAREELSGTSSFHPQRREEEGSLTLTEVYTGIWREIVRPTQELALLRLLFGPYREPPLSPEPPPLAVTSIGTCSRCGYHGPGPAHDCKADAAQLHIDKLEEGQLRLRGPNAGSLAVSRLVLVGAYSDVYAAYQLYDAETMKPAGGWGGSGLKTDYPTVVGYVKKPSLFLSGGRHGG